MPERASRERLLHAMVIASRVMELPSQVDFLVMGAGVAGLRAAVELAGHGEVLVVTKESLAESNTHYAQGGIAVATEGEQDVALHLEDTVNAGDGLVHRPTAEAGLAASAPPGHRSSIERAASSSIAQRPAPPPSQDLRGARRSAAAAPSMPRSTMTTRRGKTRGLVGCLAWPDRKMLPTSVTHGTALVYR